MKPFLPRKLGNLAFYSLKLNEILPSKETKLFGVVGQAHWLNYLSGVF